MELLISAGYRTTGRSAIWRLDAGNLKLHLFREDQYYQAGERRKDYIYFAMGIYEGKVYCVGGNVLSVLDLNGDLLERKDVDFLADAHDLKVIDHEVLCTNTGHDTLDIFSTGLAHLRSIRVKALPCFRGRKLVAETSQNTDSLHLNFISGRDGTVFLTHSFTSVKDRFLAMKIAASQALAITGLRTRRVSGPIRNGRSGRVLDAGGVFTLKGMRVVHDIHGAHDGVFSRDRFYVNSTYDIETLVYDKGFRLERRIPFDVGMILRGLYPLNEATLLLGATHVDPKRSGSDGYRKVISGRGGTRFDDCSNIKVVDSRSGDVLETIPLEPYQGIHPEIFKIIPLTQ